MTIGEYQKQSEAKLQKAGIGSANLDALILLEDTLGKDRTWILAHPEVSLKQSSVKILDAKTRRREKHEPLAYIRGITEFYGREFYVNKHVLEPRPESETMITLLKTLVNHKITYTEDGPLRVVDVGTGTGALAITAKLELPQMEVLAIDIDSNCLSVAQKNARNLGAEIKFYQGDLLGPLPTNYQLPTTILLANLPYVPDGYTVNQAAAMEPKIAIFGGEDGLSVYCKLFEQLSGHNRPKHVLTESMPPQHAKLAKIALKAGYQLVDTDDFIQVFSI